MLQNLSFLPGGFLVSEGGWGREKDLLNWNFGSKELEPEPQTHAEIHRKCAY